VQIEVFDAGGHLFGQSLWASPQQVDLSYLPAGKYFLRATARITNDYCSPYDLTATRVPGACKADADCGVSFQTQTFRSLCQPDGACGARQAPGTVPEGGSCDASSDCVSGLSCPADNHRYASSPAQRSRCARACTTDADCSGGQVCESIGSCTLPCSTAQDCGAQLDTPTDDGTPWVYSACTDGHC
jgi:hypothetical protein